MAPVNLEVSVSSRFSTSQQNGRSTLALSWDAVENATGYIVYYQTDADVFENRRASFSTTQTEASFTVSSDDIYIITVAAFRNSNSNISAESEPVAVSTLQNIEEVSPVLSNNRLSVMIRYPGVTYLGTRLIEPTFKIHLTQADGSEALYADGTAVESDFITTNPSYSFAKALAPSSNYSLTVYMGINANSDSELDEEEIFSTYSMPSAFSTDADAYPDALTSVKAEMEGKTSIRVSFTASQIKTGLENVQRRFAITRTSSDGEVVEVWPRENALRFANENDYYFIDDSESLRSNIEYTYSVTSYYYFEDSNAYNRQSSDEPTTSPEVHIFSTPTDVTAELTQTDTNTYTEEVSFTFPFGLPDDATVSLYRMETSFTETGSVWTPVENAELSGSNPYTLTSSLTVEGSHSYSYKVVVASGDITSDEGISTNVVSTGSQVENISSFTATDNLAGRIRLSWSFKDVTGVTSLRLLRSENSDYSGYTVVSTDSSATTFEDRVDGNTSPIVDGKTYYYALEASYGESVEYKYISAKSLDAVTSIDASKGTYTDRIEVTWTEVAGAKGYKVYAKTTADGAFTDADIVEGEITVSEDGVCSYSFTRDVGTAQAGRNWYFAVKPVDSEDQTTPSGNLVTATGNLLGPASIIVTASKNAYSDSILVTWNGVPGATQYQIEVYASNTDGAAAIKTEQISSQNVDGTYSYVLNAEDLASPDSAYLSQSYWFSIFPRYNASVSQEGTEKVEGCWVKPPTGITASKATSSVITFISWDAVPNTAGYFVYRRNTSSQSAWEQVGYTQTTSIEAYDANSGSNASNPYYEYTVSSYFHGIEGPMQTYFDDTDPTDGGLTDNIGFPIYHPNAILISEVVVNEYYDYLNKIEFEDNPFADQYVISSRLFEKEVVISRTDFIEVENIETLDGNSPAAGNGYIDANGKVALFVNRPVLISSFYYDLSIASRIDPAKAEFKNDNVSDSADYTRRPIAIRYREAINIANTVLTSAFGYPNSKFEGDWFYAWSDTTKRGDYSIEVGGGAITADVEETEIFQGTTQYATLAISEYTSNSISITGEFSLTVGGTKLPQQTNPVTAFTSTGDGLFVEIPFDDYPNVTIKYDSVAVDNTSGAYTISIDGSEDAVTIEASSVDVRLS